MEDDKLQRWATSVMCLSAIAVFGLFAGYALAFDVALPVGRLLALLGTGIGAVGGVGLLLSVRRGRSVPVGSLPFMGVQISLFAGLIAWNAVTIDHTVFRVTILTISGWMLCFGFLLVLAAVVFPDRLACSGDSTSDFE